MNYTKNTTGAGKGDGVISNVIRESATAPLHEALGRLQTYNSSNGVNRAIPTKKVIS